LFNSTELKTDKRKHEKQDISNLCNITLQAATELLQFDHQGAETLLELSQSMPFVLLLWHQGDTELAFQTWIMVHLCTMGFDRQQ